MRKVQVTAIAIDWQDEWDWIDPISSAERNRITKSIIGTVWDAADVGDLISQITETYGWLIESIKYKAST